MSINWYYVENNERVGPIDESEFLSLIEKSKIDEDTYVWKKGLDNWVQAKNLDELVNFFNPVDLEGPGEEGAQGLITDEEPVSAEDKNILFDWSSVDHSNQIFILKAGEDRGEEDREYGPYSLKMIERLLKENRINYKTQIFSAGMRDWVYLREVDFFSDIFRTEEEFVEKRNSRRCPISARVFLADNNDRFFQGVCRDISVGGAQVLVANFPGNVGDIVRLNMHFEEGNFAFTASGKITRLLDHVGGFAMRYTELGPSGIKMINNYVESYE